MNIIQDTNPEGQQLNRLLNAVVTMMIYNKITIDHVININVFSYVTVSYIIVSTDDVLNNTTNEIPFPELIKVFQK